MASKDFIINVLADATKADKTFSSFGESLKAKTASWGDAVKIGAAAMVTAGTAAAAGLYQVGATFDDVTDTIRVGTGLQGEALDGLVDVAKNIGTEVPNSFDEIASTVADLNTRLGLSGDTMQTVAEQYLQAGNIMGESIDIDSSTAAFNAFKISGDDVSGALDTVFQVAQSTGTSMNDLFSLASDNAATFTNLGFSFEGTVSMLGALDKAGVDATKVSASMSKGLVALARDGEEPEAAFKRVTGEIQNYVDAGDTAGALDLASQIFGTKGATQFVTALQTGALNVDDLQSAVSTTGDTILGTADDTEDFAERWQEIMNTAQVAVQPLASAIFDGLGGAITGILPYVQAFGDWAQQNPQVLMALAAAFAVLTTGLVIAAAAQWIMNSALLASPITWIILGVVALIAVIVLLATNWSTVVGWIQGIGDAFGAWWNGFWAGIGSWVQGVWDGFTSWVGDKWNGFISFLQSTGNGIAGWWNGLWSGIGGFFQGIWGGLAGFAGSAMNSVLGVVRGPINGIISLVNSMIAGINSIHVTIPDWVPGVGGQTWGANIPQIPMLANGGIITSPTVAMIGEAGPEAVIPLSLSDSGFMQQLAETIAGTLRGKTGNTFEINAIDPLLTAAVIAERIR